MIKKNNLSIFLPVRNRPKFLFNCLKSFFDLNLKKSQIVVIDEDSSVEEMLNNKLFSVKKVIEKFNNQELIYKEVSLGTSLESKLKIYLKNSTNFNYFSIMSDDDFFLKSIGIKKCIELLNKKKNISFAITSSYMFQDSPTKWIRNFNIPYNIYEGQDFLKNFINIEDLQHSTTTGIFRLKHIKTTNAFGALKKILKYKLNEGYGNDTRLYFRNATRGKVACLGKYRTRAIRFHHSGMTFQSPVESAYVYYWNIIDNIEYCKSKNININEFKEYISYWLKNLLISHIVSTFLYSEKNKKENLIRRLNNIEFISYIQNQFKKYNITINKLNYFYFKLNYLINLLPKWAFIKKNDHYIPKNYFEFIIRIVPFYYIVRIFPINLLKKIIKLFIIREFTTR